MNICKRIQFLKIVLSASLLLTVILLYNEWDPKNVDRLYPIISIPHSLGIYLFYGLCTVLIFSILTQKDIFGHLSIIFLSIMMVLHAHYITEFNIFFWLMLVAIYLSPKTQILPVCGLIVILLYFWGGLHKFNFIFFNGIFPWFTEHSLFFLNDKVKSLLAIFVPAIECSVAYFLWQPRYRKFGIFMSLGFLIFVLGSLILHDFWAFPIYPWNVCLFCCAFIIFFNQKDKYKIEVHYASFVTISFGIILQILCTFSIVPKEIGWFMYSGRKPNLYIKILSDNHSMPNGFQNFADDKGYVNFRRYVAKTSDTYIASRTTTLNLYRIKSFCKYVQNPNDLLVKIINPINIFSIKYTTKYYKPCL